MQAIASPWLYLVLFAVTIIDGFFPPIPSETVLVAAAAVTASTGEGNLLLLGAVAAIGAAIGDNIAFLIGRGLGTTRFAWMRRPRVAAAFAHAQLALDRRSATLILGARYIPVGRVAVNMTAGALDFPWRRFLPLSLIAGSQLERVQPGHRSARRRLDQGSTSAQRRARHRHRVGRRLRDRQDRRSRRRRVPTPQLAG